MSADAAPTLRVTAGGAPPPDVLAALVVALQPVGGATDHAAPAARDAAWGRAARLEGLGARTLVSPADLEVAGGGWGGP